MVADAVPIVGDFAVIEHPQLSRRHGRRCLASAGVRQETLVHRLLSFVQHRLPHLIDDAMSDILHDIAQFYLYKADVRLPILSADILGRLLSSEKNRPTKHVTLRGNFARQNVNMADSSDEENAAAAALALLLRRRRRRRRRTVWARCWIMKRLVA